MKTYIKTSILLVALALMASCKNPNATQETDGNNQPTLSPAEIDSSATQQPDANGTGADVPKDLEGDNSSNN